MHGVLSRATSCILLFLEKQETISMKSLKAESKTVFNGRLILFLSFLGFVKGFSPALVAWFNHPFTSFWFYDSDQVFVLIEFEGSFIGVDADSMNHIVIGVILKHHLVAI